MKHMATPDGITVHHGHYRLGHPAYLPLHITHIEAGHTVVLYLSATALHMHVHSGTEGLVAGSCEQHHTDVAVLPAMVQCT